MTDEKTIFLFAKDEEVCGSVVSEGSNLVYIRPIASSSGQEEDNIVRANSKASGY
jgi:hypothetical protein